MFNENELKLSSTVKEYLTVQNDAKQMIRNTDNTANPCIIPARGGSNRIPRKNIKDFLGKLIIAYSIEVALKSNLFDEVMVSTDDKEIADKYNDVLNNTKIKTQDSAVNVGHAYLLYVIQVEDRSSLYKYLRGNKIFSQLHYIPVHLHPYCRKFGLAKGDWTNAENYYEHCLSLPMYSTLSNEEQDYVIEIINQYLTITNEC